MKQRDQIVRALLACNDAARDLRSIKGLGINDELSMDCARDDAREWLFATRDQKGPDCEGDYILSHLLREAADARLEVYQASHPYAPCPYCSATDHSMVDCPCTPSETI